MTHHISVFASIFSFHDLSPAAAVATGAIEQGQSGLNSLPRNTMQPAKVDLQTEGELHHFGSAGNPAHHSPPPHCSHHALHRYVTAD